MEMMNPGEALMINNQLSDYEPEQEKSPLTLRTQKSSNKSLLLQSGAVAPSPLQSQRSLRSNHSIPSITSSTITPSRSSSSSLHGCQDASQYAAFRQNAVEDDLYAQIRALQSHFTLQSYQVASLQKEVVDLSKPKAKKRRANIQGEVLTAPEMSDLIQTRAAEAKRKAEAEAAAKEAKEAATRDRVLERALNVGTKIFDKSLMALKKDELKDIAFALSISQEGANKDLIARIKEKFEVESHLKTDIRFRGIFARKHRGKQVVREQQDEFENEVEAGPSGVQHMDYESS
ncbi:hypothetical protein M422DRAFT_50229 [Sphaerobolus stellatus SS14]|uniref:Uncharacterized protein n=1 Tax=Sphaerobolus stellatus (strain SS14) TaxID=990650 RepID=A0A0C9VKF6_SPHS4|nr:hypothetical protein M422DRAFT_50229 [Sphaerobolus stellatus SS14]